MDDYYPPPSTLEGWVMQAAWRHALPVLVDRLASALPEEETTDGH